MPSTPTNFPGTAASVVEDVSGTAWTNPGNITVDDGTEASVSLATLTYSEALTATNFGYSIAGGNVPVGFEVQWKKRQGSLVNTDIRDWHVRLIVGGVQVGDDKAITVTGWPAGIDSSFSDYVTHGGVLDLWGTSGVTVADVNATTFGFSISCKQHGSLTRSGFIDAVKATVYFEAEGQPFMRRFQSIWHVGGQKRFAQSGAFAVRESGLMVPLWRTPVRRVYGRV